MARRRNGGGSAAAIVHGARTAEDAHVPRAGSIGVVVIWLGRVLRNRAIHTFRRAGDGSLGSKRVVVRGTTLASCLSSQAVAATVSRARTRTIVPTTPAALGRWGRVRPTLLVRAELVIFRPLAGGTLDSGTAGRSAPAIFIVTIVLHGRRHVARYGLRLPGAVLRRGTVVRSPVRSTALVGSAVPADTAPPTGKLWSPSGAAHIATATGGCTRSRFRRRSGGGVVVVQLVLFLVLLVRGSAGIRHTRGGGERSISSRCCRRVRGRKRGTGGEFRRSTRRCWGGGGSGEGG